jgi:hypothetical protein
LRRLLSPVPALPPMRPRETAWWFLVWCFMVSGMVRSRLGLR